jgi:antitoxin ParD1/3/4
MARQLTVTLPDDVAYGLDARLAAGEFESESAVVVAGLRALGGGSGLEEWLRDAVVPVYDQVKRDPSVGRPLREFAAEFEAKRRKPA